MSEYCENCKQLADKNAELEREVKVLNAQMALLYDDYVQACEVPYPRKPETLDEYKRLAEQEVG